MSATESSAVMGRSIAIRGDLIGTEDLVVNGDIEGSVTMEGAKLTIGPNARVKANLAARDIIIFGHVTGSLRASGRVELRQAAVLEGDIVASRLTIEENAMIKGRAELNVGTGASAEGEQAKAAKEPAAVPGQAKA